jgi:DNA-binding Lrp family transcriptional regulator
MARTVPADAAQRSTQGDETTVLVRRNAYTIGRHAARRHRSRPARAAAGLARTTVQSRLARLERERVIAGYTVVTPDEAESALVRAHVLITARPKAGAGIEAALRKWPELRTLHSVSGPFDLIAVLAADSIGTLDRLIDRIGALDGVERTTSAIVLSTRIAR